MNKLDERGFGLIELMVSLAIASFLVLGLVV
ncbi:MAG: prepilin-type N-terminal cleavage/methylation domain-containing protein, partial [Burkholderiales bacterium]